MWTNNRTRLHIILTLFLVTSVTFIVHKSNSHNKYVKHFSDDSSPKYKVSPRPKFFYMEEEDVGNETKIWISMGLCWGENTELYGKSKYPYATVTPLAVLLWKYHLPHVNVLVQVVTTQVKKTTGYLPILNDYMDSLRRAGAVVRQVETEGTDCVLKSQMIRLFAFDHPLVKENDIVVTFDVNGFVMNDRILDPIFNDPYKTAWIFQYEDTAHIETGTGETFNENLIAMRASKWKEIMDYQDGMTFAVWLRMKQLEFDLDQKPTWYHDQWITTLSILKHKVCNVPQYSGLWKNTGIEFDSNFDDSELCFHGKGYKDCNRDIHIVYQGCKWWHFYPDEPFENHVEKFHELSNNTFELGLHSPLDGLTKA